MIAIPNPDESVCSGPVEAVVVKPSGPGLRLSFTIHVPYALHSVFQQAGQDARGEINRVIEALFAKVTRDPADNPRRPYAGEVRRFERLLKAPPEALSMAESFFVDLESVHARLRWLIRSKGPEAVRREICQAAADLAEWVEAAQEVVRLEWAGKQQPACWEVPQ